MDFPLVIKYADRGMTQALRELLDSEGVDVNVVDPSTKGMSALHYAVQSKYPDCAELLVGQGSDVNLRDNHGMTALSMAALNGQPDVVQMLISHGADVNLSDDKDKTPAMHACYFDYVECLSILTQNGADINAKNLNEETALMIAARSGSSEVAPGGRRCLGHLLTLGADVNAVDVRGYTALIKAVRSGDAESAKMLLDHGVDATIEDISGASALYKATFASSYYFSPIYLARKERTRECVNMLLPILDPNEEKTKKQIGKCLKVILRGCNAGRIRNAELLNVFLRHQSIHTLIQDTCLERFEKIVLKGNSLMTYTLVKNGTFPADGIFMSNKDVTICPEPILRYLLINNCLSGSDVQRIQNAKSFQVKQNSKRSTENRLETGLKSQPWPLVKLCLAVVSSSTGSGLNRVDRIQNIGLPDSLQRLLLLKIDTIRLCPDQWQKIPLIFDLDVYDRGQLLMSNWPMKSQPLLPCVCGSCGENGLRLSKPRDVGCEEDEEDDSSEIDDSDDDEDDDSSDWSSGSCSSTDTCYS